MNRSHLILGICLLTFQLSAQDWKRMMNDPQVNVYDVIEAAEAYFETVDKDAKGSGWKGYNRWRFENEPKFFPTGDRSKSDPFFTANAYRSYQKSNPQTSRALDRGNWLELGPYYIETVTGHYSCGLGRVESFVVDSENPDRIYLGSRSGGFWKTLDGGKSWTGGSTDTLIATGVNSMTASPTNTDSVLINLRNPLNGVTHGIYRTGDAGDTWAVTQFNPATLGWGGLGTSDNISEIAYHPTIPNLVFIASSRGLFRSDDDLESWTTPVANTSMSAIVFHPTNPDIVYAASWSDQFRIYISRDGGVSFSRSNVIPNNSSTIRLSTTAACPECVYVGSSDGVWRSTDEGMNFTSMGNAGVPNYGGFTVSDVSTNYILTGDLDVYMSEDGGQSFNIATFWSRGDASYAESGQYVHADIRGAKSIDGTLWINTDGFLCRSNDFGSNWEFFEGQSIRENYNLAVSQSNHYRTVCGSQDNGTSINTENGWIEFYGADGMEGVIHPLNDDWMIASLQFGGRIRTKDGGYTQDGVTPPGSEEAFWIAPLIIDPNDQMVVYDFRESIYRSEDFGSSWVETGNPGFGGVINYAAIAENNSNIMAVTSYNEVALSRDGGSSFSRITSNLPFGYISDVTFDPGNDDVIVVTYGSYQNDNNKVFITFDQGVTWNNITLNLGDLPVRTVAIDHTDESNIYLGTELGVYKKAIEDDSWSLYSPGLPSVTVRELEVMHGSNTLRAATWGRGLWEFKLAGRADYPEILTTAITDPPTSNNPKANVDQNVTSVISYDGDIQSAFIAWSVDSIAFDNVIEMNNISDSTWQSAMPIPGQTEGKKVFFKVYAVGSNMDTTVTYKFMYEATPFALCESFGNLAYATAVTRVNFNDIDNASGKTQSYTDYTETDSTVLISGPDYDLNVNLNTDGDYVIFANAWIDWNRDADFDDPGEEYDLGTARNTPDGATSLSPMTVSVPLDAKVGKTIMRVSCEYNETPAGCGVYFDGEVEDYTIIVRPTTIVEEISASICTGDSLFVGSEWQYSSGIFYDTLNVSPIVDSVIITTIEVYERYELVNELVGCDSLSLPDGTTFYENYDTTLLVAGVDGDCDTVLVTSITINHSQSSEVWESACDSYTVPSGLATYTESGTYSDIISSANGCDSVITINLEIVKVDTSVRAMPPELIAQAENATFQWFDCDTQLPIPGATDPSFVAPTMGSFAVIVMQNECIDTSSCYYVQLVSVVENTFDRDIEFYPNPTSGKVLIELGIRQPSIRAKIISMDGRILESETFKQTEKLELNIEGPSGYYLIELLGENGRRALLQVLKN